MSHIVEEESGTYVSRHDHAHNGYYAGDFSAVPFTVPGVRLPLSPKNDASSPRAA
jgi:hypothetical protein